MRIISISRGKSEGRPEGAKRPTAGDEPREFTSRGEGGRVPPFFEKLQKCNAQFRNANGVCAQGHLFYLTSKQLVQEGQPNCDHDWVLSGSGYPFGAVSPIYSVLIYLSFALFLIGALALIGIGISLCRQTRELDPRRKGHLC